MGMKTGWDVVHFLLDFLCIIEFNNAQASCPLYHLFNMSLGRFYYG